MAVESKGKYSQSKKDKNDRDSQAVVKRRNTLQTTPNNKEETYEQYIKRHANEGSNSKVIKSEPFVASTNTEALEEMFVLSLSSKPGITLTWHPRVLQLKKQADGTGAQISELMMHITSHSSAAESSSPDEGLWTGATHGRTLFCPRDDGSEVKVYWTFSICGIEHQDAESRGVGDIHFSTPTTSTASTSSLTTSTGTAHMYWVCVRSKKTKSGSDSKLKRWALYEPGQSHPVYSSYVLRKRVGNTPPGWVQV
ncbi:hypothetical protein FRC08_008422 [Ceratobasidium sp. 394]|nr:hypothetical protein FRC08_008422 [Ceratobasidium sp. 394]